jgi:hypothetical protein
MKATNRGTVTSQNAKNRGIVAEKIVKFAALSRQLFGNCGFVATKLSSITSK